MFDVKLPDSGESYALRLDADGHAQRDYDAFVKYPAEFEAEDAVRATKWEDRGIGTFIKVTATPDNGAIRLALSFERAEFLGLTPHNVQGYVVNQPSFGSRNITTEIHVRPGEWTSFDIVKFRIRKDDSSRTDTSRDKER